MTADIQEVKLLSNDHLLVATTPQLFELQFANILFSLRVFKICLNFVVPIDAHWWYNCKPR